MRILMVTEASGGGTGRHVADLTAGLRQRGHDVFLAYAPQRIDATFADFVANCPRRTVRAVPMRRRPHSSDLAAVEALRRFAAQEGPFDVAHGHSSKAGIVTRCRRLATASVYTPHGVFTMNPLNGRLSRWIATQIERRFAARCDAVVAVSAAERDHLLGLGITADKVHYVPNGLAPQVWPSRQVLRTELGLDPNDLVVGFIGRLTSEKDPCLLLDAFARAWAGAPRARLAMVGEGELGETCRLLAARLGIADRVAWLGYRRPQQCLPAFDVMAISSRFESMPYVLLEAFAAGIPVVATAVAGMRLAIEDGHNGLLVRSHEPAAFAAALHRLLLDATLRSRMAAFAAASAASHTAEAMIDRTLDVYRQLLAASTETRPALEPELTTGTVRA